MVIRHEDDAPRFFTCQGERKPLGPGQPLSDVFTARLFSRARSGPSEATIARAAPVVPHATTSEAEPGSHAKRHVQRQRLAPAAVP